MGNLRGFVMKKIMIAAAAVAAFAAAGPAFAQYSASSSYANPDQTTTQVYQTSRKVCNDPWVTIALIRVYGSADPAKCAPALYNNGQWSDYNQLVHAVAKTRDSFAAAGIDLKLGTQNGQTVVAILQGGSLVAAGGGNLVAAGGGNLVAAGGGNLVAAGGGNLIVPPTTPPANLVAAGGGNYTLQSGRSVKLPAGNGLRW